MHVAQDKFNYSEGSEQQEVERIFFTLSRQCHSQSRVQA